MSWSVGGFGHASAVRAKLASDLAKISCPEPENTIKNNVAASIDLALAGLNPDAVVKVEASGSQSTGSFGVTNTLNVKIEQQWGFVANAAAA